MKILIPAPPKRIKQHALLLSPGAPFRPKTEKRKDLYQRKPKYQKPQWQD